MKLRNNNWKRRPIGEVCNLINGRAFKPIDWGNSEGGGLPIIRIQNLNNKDAEFNYYTGTYSEKNLIRTGDLLFSWSGSRGTSFGAHLWEREKAILNQHIFKVEHSDKSIDRKYLHITLNNAVFEVESNLHGGVGLVHITKGNLEKIKIPIPHIEEQKQIAALFQSIETAVEDVEGQERNLHQLKHKLLRDLFSEKKEFGNHLKAKDFEPVRFDEIAINISERVEPKKTELTTYVGLEHLDADNLKIERTGTPDDVIGTKLKIYKGDIIFGKRRAYLRKVAVSHFDGIASAHSMILRANETNIEKDFLPYFMQSDTFMSRAVQISEGSLSPTIKNKTLAVQEFILPKKEKQKELISLFSQFDITINQLKQQKTTLKNLKQKLLNEILG